MPFARSLLAHASRRNCDIWVVEECVCGSEEDFWQVEELLPIDGSSRSALADLAILLNINVDNLHWSDFVAHGLGETSMAQRAGGCMHVRTQK